LLPAQAAGIHADGLSGCKLWVVAMLVSECLHRDVDNGTSAGCMINELLHAGTATYAIEAAFKAGFGLVDGVPKKWKAIMHFAHDLGVWARTNGLACKYASTVCEGDATLLPNAGVGGQYAFLTDLHWGRVAEGESLKPWLVGHYLFHPMAPVLPAGAHNSPIANALLVRQTARKTFPALAEVSLPDAILKLLAVDVPWQLVHLGDDAASRVAYVALLGEWATLAKRPEAIQQHFATFLKQETCVELEGWVGEMPDPFAASLRIAKQILGDDRPSVDLIERLSSALGGFSTVWSQGSTQAENVYWLLQEVTRSRASSAGSGHALVAAQDITGDTAQALNERIKAHYSAHVASELLAVSMVFQSAHGPSIRWLLGPEGLVRSDLPPDLQTLGIGMVSHLHEYLIEGMRRDEKGNLDPSLKDLTVATLSGKGGSQTARRSFFINVFAANWTNIKWDEQFVAPLLRLSDPNTVSYDESDDFLYTDMERHAARLKLVGLRPRSRPRP
jgi:hypothetical protein